MAIQISDETISDRQTDKDAVIRDLREQLRAAQKLSMLGTMSSMVIHEFNNLLTPITNYAHLARRNPEMIDKALDAATRVGAQAHSICNAFLGMTHESPDHAEPVRLRALAEETIAAMGRDPARDRIAIHCNLSNATVLLARRDRLQQVLLNLLLNARQVLIDKPGDRWIRISSQIKDDTVVLRVADNGPGMTPDVRERIFQPFFTTSPNAKSGSGLGLTVCQNIIREMGGTIGVTSTPGLGTVFTLSLPQESGYLPGR